MKNKGFTLIEMLVVVLIIGILAAIALPQYYTARNKALYSRMLPIVKSVLDAEQRYYMVNNTFTYEIDKLDIELGGEVGTQSDGDKRSTITYPWGECGFGWGVLADQNFYCGTNNLNISFECFAGSKTCQCIALTDNNNSREYKFCANLPYKTIYDASHTNDSCGVPCYRFELLF